MSGKPPVRLVEVARGDFNRRFRVDLHDGYAVECVLYRGDTLCLSSQVGCAVGCPFCASGANGLVRPLSAAELAGQLEAVRRTGAPVARVTISGVGEPLHNVQAVGGFVERCHAERTPVSVTTSGGPVARLLSALHWPHNGLTVSVHAGSENVRARAVVRGPSLHELFECLAHAWPGLSRRRRRKVALAYLLLRDVNDSDEEVDAFAQRALTLPGVRVHLYAHNAVSTSPWQGATRERYEEVAARLRGHGLYVQLASRARREANGGCGTLVMLRNAPTTSSSA